MTHKKIKYNILEFVSFDRLRTNGLKYIRTKLNRTCHIFISILFCIFSLQSICFANKADITASLSKQEPQQKPNFLQKYLLNRQVFERALWIAPVVGIALFLKRKSNYAGPYAIAHSVRNNYAQYNHNSRQQNHQFLKDTFLKYLYDQFFGHTNLEPISCTFTHDAYGTTEQAYFEIKRTDGIWQFAEYHFKNGIALFLVSSPLLLFKYWQQKMGQWQQEAESEERENHIADTVAQQIKEHKKIPEQNQQQAIKQAVYSLSPHCLSELKKRMDPIHIGLNNIQIKIDRNAKAIQEAELCKQNQDQTLLQFLYEKRKTILAKKNKLNQQLEDLESTMTAILVKRTEIINGI